MNVAVNMVDRIEGALWGECCTLAGQSWWYLSETETERSYPSATKRRSVVDLRRRRRSSSSSSSSSSSIQPTLFVNPQGSTHKWMGPLNSYSGRLLVSVKVEVSFWFTKTALSTGKVRYGTVGKVSKVR